MLQWTVLEIDKILKIVLDASSGTEVDKFSKYAIQALFVQFRALVELQDLDQHNAEKLRIKYFCDISLHPELNGLYGNPAVSAEVDVACLGYTKVKAETLIYNLFSYSVFKSILVFIIDRYTLNQSYKSDKIIREIYVKYLWFLSNKPLNIRTPGGIFSVIFDVQAQAAQTPITWACDYQNQRHTDSLNLR